MILSAHGYLLQEDAILMMHRNKKKGDSMQDWWIGVGGKFEPGETPEACMRREALEETGLVLEDLKLRAFVTFAQFDGENDWYVFFYTSERFSGTLTDCKEGTLHWIAQKDLLNLPLSKGDRLIFKWMQRYPFFSARLDYDSSQELVYSQVTPYSNLSALRLQPTDSDRQAVVESSLP